MTNEKNSADDVRSKFLEALEKKKKSASSTPSGGPSAGSKVGGGQASGGAPKRFQRKSGSSGPA